MIFRAMVLRNRMRLQVKEPFMANQQEEDQLMLVKVSIHLEIAWNQILEPVVKWLAL